MYFVSLHFSLSIPKKLQCVSGEGKNTCDTVTCFSGLFLCSRSTTPYFDLKISPPLDRCKWCNYIQSPGQREEDNLIPTSLLISSLHEKSCLNNTRVKRDPHSSSNDAKGRTFVSLISPRTPCYGEPHACWGSELSREEQVCDISK